jgi:hypothetical protein
MADLNATYQHIRHWIQHAKLNNNPDMPPEVRGREADNWRPLISIADACSPAWGALAREAAIALSQSDHDEDIGVTALHHIRAIFGTGSLERIASKELVSAMINLPEADGIWGEYRGPNGDRRPRKLSQTALAELLRPFGIRPRTMWPPDRDTSTKSFRGYLREDFEGAWRDYCDCGAGSRGPRLQLVGQ